MIRCSCIFSLVTLSSLVGILDAADSDGLQFALVGRSNAEARCPSQAVICGPNALYMLLRAHGRSVLAECFFSEVEPGDHGLSLAELRDASKNYGLPAEARRCTYRELIDGCRLPLVALLRPAIGIDHRGPGHYVLVVNADSEGVTLIDGTTAEQTYCVRDRFSRDWTGYVVMPEVVQPNWLLIATTVPMWVLIGWLAFRSTRPRTGSSARS
jgi:hypothetical protein